MTMTMTMTNDNDDDGGGVWENTAANLAKNSDGRQTGSEFEPSRAGLVIGW